MSEVDQAPNRPSADRASLPILVFGATGQQGGAVARALHGDGWAVRALVRDPASAKALALAEMGVQLVAGDFNDAGSVRRAMTGAYGVFSIQPSSGQRIYGLSDEEEIIYGQGAADLALELGVEHFVYTSVGISGEGPTGLPHLDSKATIEAHVRSLDLRYTILRPGTFMDSLVAPGMGLEEGRLNFFTKRDLSRQVIAVDDIGRIAAAVFANPDRYARRSINIAGDAVTGDDLAEALTAAAGRLILYERFTPEILASDVFFGRTAELFDEGRIGTAADIAALNAEFGPLKTFREWLASTGKPLLQEAIKR